MRRRTHRLCALLLLALLMPPAALERPARADARVERDASAAVGSEADPGPRLEPMRASPASVRRLGFDVYLDDRRIGYQQFDLTPLPDGLAVETRARFELTLLRIKALDYDHRNRERWQRGCLQSIDSATRQNGKLYRVAGVAGRDGFAVEGSEGRSTLEDCVRSFAYWDRSALLGRSRLLNSQTGEYVPVRTRALGSGTLRLGEREIPVERYLIEGEKLEIRLAYASDGGEWLALDSPLFAGRTLRYRRRASELDVTRPTIEEPAGVSATPPRSPGAPATSVAPSDPGGRPTVALD